MRVLIAAVLSFVLTSVLGAGASPDATTVRFESLSWTFHDPGARVLPYLQRESIYLEGGIATVDADFADGTIEFDVAMHAFPSFAGVVFRGQSPEDFEVVYVRPQRSRQPDAIQYTPVFGGNEAWQLYVGDGYTAGAELPTGRWMHVRLVVAGRRADLYLDGAATPHLTVSDLKRPWARGTVGLFGRYGANFSRVTIATANGVPPAPVAASPAPGVVSHWRLGPAAETASVDVERVAVESPSQPWDVVPTESSGLLNLARYRRLTPVGQRTRKDDTRDTVFARTTLVSDRARRVRLTFGYSDEIVLFLNGLPLFRGTAGYLSRDSAYLGTLALGQDSVYLDLRPGRNELAAAVTERFGGWGLAARLEQAAGVTVE